MTDRFNTYQDRKYGFSSAEFKQIVFEIPEEDVGLATQFLQNISNALDARNIDQARQLMSAFYFVMSATTNKPKYLYRIASECDTKIHDLLGSLYPNKAIVIEAVTGSVTSAVANSLPAFGQIKGELCKDAY